jgi:pimeloyl-ACP methyl ester carboxylesterase
VDQIELSLARVFDAAHRRRSNPFTPMARRAVWSERTRYAVTTRGAPSLLREIETDVVKGCRALLHVLDSNVPTREDALRQITIPTLVAIGDRDERSDADELAALL